MSSKRKRARTETTLKSQDLQGFINEFHSESDRATAVLGAALLDEKLLQLLETFFVDDKAQVDLLLQTEQPLGSLGARIRIAYCLGLITRNHFDTLTIIKGIRNAFAHQLHGLSFATPSIAKECDKLRSLVQGSDYVQNSPRGIFLCATLSAQLELWGMTTSIEASKRRCKSPQWTTLVQWKRKPN